MDILMNTEIGLLIRQTFVYGGLINSTFYFECDCVVAQLVVIVVRKVVDLVLWVLGRIFNLQIMY